MLEVLLLDNVGVATGFTPRCVEVDVLIGLLFEAEASQSLSIGYVRAGESHEVKDGLRPVFPVVVHGHILDCLEFSCRWLF